MAKASLKGMNITTMNDYMEDIVTKNPTSLDLSSNNLAALPDMSSLRSLTELNVRSNAFTSVSSILPALKSLPNLRSLHIDASSDAEEYAIVYALPSLEFLNGVSLADDSSSAQAQAAPTLPQAQSAGAPPAPEQTPSIKEISLGKEDLESAALLFGTIKNLRGQLSSSDDDQLAKNFDTHVRSVMSTLQSKLTSLRDPFLRKGEILMAKHALYDICFNEAIAVAAKSSPDFGASLRKLREIHSDLFVEFPTTLHEMRPHYLQKLSEMSSQVQRAEQESAMLLQAAEVLEKEAEQHNQEKAAIIQTYEADRMRLAGKMETMIVQEPGQKQGGRHPQQSRSGTGAGGGFKGMPSSFANAMAGPLPPGATPGAGAFGDAGGPPRAEKASSSPGKNVRVLSLKQLKDNFIELIYDSKEKYDAKCKESRLPRETMEQHMYTFLNQRYGLKSLIVEHASAIIKAVNKYSDVDNDVAVFGKILRNEIDEEYRMVQSQLKQTVVELLRVYLRGKYPLKTDDQINRVLVARMKRYVEEEEWVDIIKYMYNHEDGLAVMVLVKDCISLQPTPLASTSMPGANIRGRRRASLKINQARVEQEASGGRIPFQDFLKVLLDFQLKGHEKFLAKFRQYFREVDTDKDGVLAEDEFRSFVGRIDPKKTMGEVDRLLELVDPYNNQHITFSEAVSVLSAELIAMMQR